MYHRARTHGASFIDLMLSIAIVVLLFGGIFSVYFSILDSASNIELRAAATSVLNQKVETIRNLPYDNVGTVGGIPAGSIPQEQAVEAGDTAFNVQTTIRNIDDPFDGTLGGAPNDTAPADYKLVTLVISCPTCIHFVSLSFSTTIAPKNLESAGKNGSLFVNVLDAEGDGIANAAVHVVNASVTPSIDLTDTTNASGALQLVGVPTSTQSYQITVTKSGYSSEKTYSIGAPSNPNPITPHATVAEQTLTTLSVLIDKVSVVTVSSSNALCAPIGNVGVSITGAKLIGKIPDVYKFSTSSETNTSGSLTFSNMEWDTYSLDFDLPSYTLAGTAPLVPVVVNPSSTVLIKVIMAPAINPSLLVAVGDFIDKTGITEASVNISKSGFSQTLITGHAIETHTDWSSNQYGSQDGGIDADTDPGKLTLIMDEVFLYSTSTTASWLISNTIDLGGSSSTLYALSWNPTTQLPQTGVGSLSFQLAANNDGSTWNFVGPDGTAGTYFTASSTIPAQLSGNRYVRYKVFMKTEDENFTPTVNDVSIEFNSACVPPYHAFFTGLPTGTYDIKAAAAHYLTATSSIIVSGGSRAATLELIHE